MINKLRCTHHILKKKRAVLTKNWKRKSYVKYYMKVNFPENVKINKENKWRDNWLFLYRYCFSICLTSPVKGLTYWHGVQKHFCFGSEIHIVCFQFHLIIYYTFVFISSECQIHVFMKHKSLNLMWYRY